MRAVIPDNDWMIVALEFFLHCDYKRAITAARKAIFSDPCNDVAWLIIGDSHFKLNRFKEAIDAYDNVLQITPRNENAWLNIAEAFYRSNQPVAALENANKALSINLNISRAWLIKGMILRDLNKYEDAIWCYDRALEIDPAIKGIRKLDCILRQGLDKKIPVANR